MDGEYTSAPNSLVEALSRPDSNEWVNAVTQEIESLTKKGTWKIVALPDGAKAIESKCVFVLKLKADGTVDKYKARFVAKGFQE